MAYMTKIIDRDKLLAALAELPQERGHVFRTLPLVLNQHGEGHVSVAIVDPDGGVRIAASNDPTVSDDAPVPEDGVIARVERSQHAVYITDTSTHPEYRQVGAHRYPVELALPVFERDHVVAVLNLERATPLDTEERRALEAFTSAISHYLTQGSRSRQSSIATELSAALSEAVTYEEAAGTAVTILARATGASAATFMHDRGGAMRAVAAVGLEPSAVDRVPYAQGLVWEACLTGRAGFSRDYRTDLRAVAHLRDQVGPVVVALPIDQHHTPRAALCLHYPQEAHVSAADLELLAGVGRHLALILTVIKGNELQDHLLELHAKALDSATTDLYQHVLDAAIKHVPGAEAGSLIVLPVGADEFRYVAVNGFEPSEVEHVRYSELDMRRWYGGSDEEWAAGRARVLTAESLDLAAFSCMTNTCEQPVTPEAMRALKSTACLPVTFRGEVLAVLNLDNFTRHDAFGGDSLRTLAQFGPPVAVLLAAAQHRDEITRASRTDPLTGLVNREGFQVHLEQQLGRSGRSAEPFTLPSMDLTGFKQVNDSLGHAVGDEALVRVARALVGSSRQGDVVGRWGGDEFVALLPAAGPLDAERAVERLETAVASIELHSHRLGVDIGIATYPEDGVDLPELLRVADARMYARKARHKGALRSA